VIGLILMLLVWWGGFIWLFGGLVGSLIFWGGVIIFIIGYLIYCNINDKKERVKTQERVSTNKKKIDIVCILYHPTYL
jgi:hypothetical protein